MDHDLIKPSEILLNQQKSKAAKSLRNAAVSVKKKSLSIGQLLSIRREIDYGINAIIEEMFALERDKEEYKHNQLVYKYRHERIS